MKRFENFSIEDLQSLRNEIALNSLFVSDYNNSFGISAKSVSLFFDSYMSFIDEMAKEDGFKYGYQSEHSYDEFFDKYDTIDNLYDWYGCYESFDWVEYEDEDEDEDEIDIAA